MLFRSKPVSWGVPGAAAGLQVQRWFEAAGHASVALALAGKPVSGRAFMSPGATPDDLAAYLSLEPSDEHVQALASLRALGRRSRAPDVTLDAEAMALD